MRNMDDKPDWLEPDDDDDDPDLWDENRWEEALKDSDERSKKFGELIEKYGFEDENMEKIFEEMGWSDIYQDLQDAQALQSEEPGDDEPPDPDEVIEESKLISQLESDENAFALPLGQNAFDLAEFVLNIQAREDEIHPDHPLIVMINGVLDCTGNLAGAGYMHSWGEEDMLDDQPKGLRLALLKRSRNNLLRALTMLDRLEENEELNQTLATHIRDNSSKLMLEINAEIKLLRSESAGW